jgi:hypothetical protein
VTRLRESARTTSQFARIIRAFAVTSQLAEEEIPGVLAYAQTLNGEEREVDLDRRARALVRIQSRRRGGMDARQCAGGTRPEPR